MSDNEFKTPLTSERGMRALKAEKQEAEPDRSKDTTFMDVGAGLDDFSSGLVNLPAVGGKPQQSGIV